MEHTDTISENSLNIENDTTQDTDNSNFEIPLKLNDRLKSKGIIQNFVKDKKT